jgi:hypothetical protein
MGYNQRTGRRPMEQASKSAHSFVINDPEVSRFLASCALPKTASEVNLDKHTVVPLAPVSPNPIRHVVAVDSGYTEVSVKKDFPSSKICFFQFGVLYFSVADLDDLGRQPFIDPEDMAKLKRIERFKLALPIQNIAINGQPTLTRSVRATLHEFFCRQNDGTNLMETLRWLLFEEFHHPVEEYSLASCPECEAGGVKISRKALAADCRFACEKCGKHLYLTDCFRLHEAMTDEIGASGILGYLTTLIEQFVMAHFIRLILAQQPALLKQILFIKDGPLAFFGQTANMHKKMRALAQYLFAEHNLYMAGLEKSGAFVEHAAEVSTIMGNGSALILDNEYIYGYIIPGDASHAEAYGSTTYYSAKLIFKSRDERVYVASLPTAAALRAPLESDINNLQVVLTNIEKLRCDMYDDALIPIALVNKLVSLANRPSSKVLQQFAVTGMGS